MASYFTLTLDTTAPTAPSIEINSGDTYTSSQTVSVAASASGTPTQVKFWGAVDTSYDADVQTLEVNSAWKTLSSPHTIKLSTGDGSKTVYAKLRDAVGNASSEASDSITLDTEAPTVSWTSGPDVSTISKIATFNTCVASFTPAETCSEYKVKVVPATGSAHDAGTQIPTTAGSANVSGSGTFAGDTPIEVTIKGTDLETAKGDGDGSAIIKVFIYAGGSWSN